jgi:hypothetical protein
MKRLVILLCIAQLTLSAKPQEMTFGLSTTAAVSTQFNRPVGIYGSYSWTVNQKMRWGFDLLANFSLSDYNRIQLNKNTGVGYVIEITQPQSIWLALSTSATFNVFTRGCLNLWLGPQLSVNNFFCNEEIMEIPAERVYRDKHNYLMRPGIGGNIEIELKGIFRKKMSLVTSFQPQITLYGKVGDDGSNVEGTLLANITRIGLRYQL